MSLSIGDSMPVTIDIMGEDVEALMCYCVSGEHRSATRECPEEWAEVEIVELFIEHNGTRFDLGNLIDIQRDEFVELVEEEMNNRFIDAAEAKADAMRDDRMMEEMV